MCFYRVFKPFNLGNLSLDVFVGTITFSWRSTATMYAICFYIAATVVVLIVGYERIMILRSIRRFDEYIYAILFVVFLVPHFWIPFVGWGVAHQVAIYKTNWGKFQVSPTVP